MIIIDRIDEPKYDFPTVDFKFQNSGSATAYLWKFIVNVMSAEVDLTPVLDFEVHVEAGELHLTVTNNGWGAASKFTIDIEEKTLGRLFDRSALRFTGFVNSGECVCVLRLSVTQVSVEAFRALESELQPPIDKRYQHYRQDQIGDTSREPTPALGIRLGKAHITSTFTDETGQIHNEHETLLLESRKGGVATSIAVSPTGFVEFRGSPLCYAAAPSDTTYISLLDPCAGPHERVYSMSRKIASGDIEQFHVMVGAAMSCRLRIKFKFFIDKDAAVESDEFDVHIWNPRNVSSWRLHDYKDGSELPRHISDSVKFISHRIAERLGAQWERKDIDRLKTLREFPFSRGRYR